VVASTVSLPRDTAHVAALLDSPEVASLIAQIEATRWTGRPGYSIRAMVGLALVKSLYCLPTWTRAVALVRDHDGLRDVLGAVPSVDAACRFTVKLRAHGDMLAVCIGKMISALREAHPEMGQTVAIDGSDLPAYANGQKYVSRGGALRKRFSDPDASWGSPVIGFHPERRRILRLQSPRRRLHGDRAAGGMAGGDGPGLRSPAGAGAARHGHEARLCARHRRAGPWLRLRERLHRG
jgi:hypothetical protein